MKLKFPALENTTPAMNNNWRRSLVWLGSQHMVVKYYQRKWIGNPMVRPHRIMILMYESDLMFLLIYIFIYITSI